MSKNNLLGDEMLVLEQRKAPFMRRTKSHILPQKMFASVLLMLLLGACVSDPKIDELRAAKNPEEVAKGVAGVSGYLKSEKIKDSHLYMQTLDYADWAFSQLTPDLAVRAEATGEALKQFSLKPRLIVDADTTSSARRQSIRSLGSASAPWATQKLLDIYQQNADDPDEDVMRYALLHHLTQRLPEWPKDAFTSSRARAVVVHLDSAGMIEDKYLKEIRARAYTIEGLGQDGASVPEVLIDRYAALFAAQVESSGRSEDAAMDLGFKAYTARRNLFSAGVQEAIDDEFSSHAPAAYVEYALPRLTASNPVSVLRMLRAASKGKAAGGAWSGVAFSAADKQFHAAYIAAKEPAVLLELAGLYAGYSSESTKALHALLVDTDLDVNHVMAAQVALSQHPADEAQLVKMIEKTLVSETEAMDRGLQSEWLAYAATWAASRDSVGMIRSLTRFARAADDGNGGGAAAGPFLEAYLLAITHGDEADLSGSPGSIIREILTREPDQALDRLRAYLSGVPAEKLYVAFFSGISSAMGDVPETGRAPIMVLVSNMLRNGFSKLDDPARSRVISTFSQQISESAQLESALKIAAAGLALAAGDQPAVQRLRQALDRRIKEGSSGDLQKQVSSAPAKTEKLKFREPAVYGYFFHDDILAALQALPTPQTVANELFGSPIHKVAQAEAAPPFGSVAEVMLIPKGPAVYRVNATDGLALEQIVAFDELGHLMNAALPIRPSRFPIELSRLSMGGTNGTARIDDRGQLRIDGLNAVVAATKGIELGFSLNGSALAGSLKLEPDFRLSEPLVITRDAPAGRDGDRGSSGSAGDRGRDGKDGDGAGWTAGQGFKGSAGSDGSDGGRGTAGGDAQPGEAAKPLYIVAKPIVGAVAGERLYWVVVQPGAKSFVLPESGLMKISLRGGSGGAGGDGGAGGRGGTGGTGGDGGRGGKGAVGRRGQNGSYCNYAGCNCNGGQGGEGGRGGPGGPGAKGGDGGDGGAGGAGGNAGKGGAGGVACILFSGDSASRQLFIERLKIDVSGGRGGKAGSGGAAGSSGDGGRSGSGGPGGYGGDGGPGGPPGNGTITSYRPDGTYVNSPMYCSVGSGGNSGDTGNGGNDGTRGNSGGRYSAGASGSNGSAGVDGSILAGALGQPLEVGQALPSAESLAAQCAPR